jgi:Spy/CpxP family protein refolding chaperone
MRLIRTIFSLISIIWLVAVSNAQPGPPSKEQRLAHLKDTLELTAEQTVKVSAILDTTEQQIEQMRNSTSDDREKRREAMHKIMKEEDVRMGKVLTESQKKKYDQLREERRKHHQEHGPGGPGPGGPGEPPK